MTDRPVLGVSWWQLQFINPGYLMVTFVLGSLIRKIFKTPDIILRPAYILSNYLYHFCANEKHLLFIGKVCLQKWLKEKAKMIKDCQTAEKDFLFNLKYIQRIKTKKVVTPVELLSNIIQSTHRSYCRLKYKWKMVLDNYMLTQSRQWHF